MSARSVLLFDFGGTLDSDGVPWKERFFRIWTEEVQTIDRARFDRAFHAADDELVGGVPRDLTLSATIGRLGRGLASRLGAGAPTADRAAGRFARESLDTLVRPRCAAGAPRVHAPARHRARISTATSSPRATKPGSALTSPPRSTPSTWGASSRTRGSSAPPWTRCARIPRGRVRRRLAGAGHGGRTLARDAHVLVREDGGAGGPGCCPGTASSRGSRTFRRPCVSGATRSPLLAGILAAGEGSRLRRDGWTVAKPLVPVGGVTLIEHAIENLFAAGADRISILFNEAEEDCARFVREKFPRREIDVGLRTTPSSLETFRELSRRLPPGPALFSTVDAWCPREDFVRFAGEASRFPDSTVLAVTPFVDDERPLWVRWGRDGRVSRIGGPTAIASPRASIGFRRARVRWRSPPRGSLDRLRAFLAWLVEENEPMEAVEIAKVIDVDRSRDVALAEELEAETGARAAESPR